MISGGIGWKPPGSEVSLLRGSGKLSGNHESDLRDLESDSRLSASRRLVELSEQHAILSNPTARLSLVRALARHEKRRAQVENVHLEIIRALIFLVDTGNDGLEQVTETELESGALRHLARGTAAMALARSRHPLALKKLLAMALGGDQLDPTGAQIALGALRSVPKSALQTKELVRLFSAPAIEKIFFSENDASLVLGHGAKVSTETLTPRALVLASKGFEPGYVKPRTESTVSDPTSDSLSFEAVITLLLKKAALPRSFAHVSSWEEALKEDPVWTLRSVALLGSRLEDPVIEWGKRTALRSTRATSKLERSAGAWCSATLAPESAPELLKRDDPIITKAVLLQASEGEVSRSVATMVRKDSLEGEEADLALRMILQNTSLWSDFSTSFLRRHEAEHGAAVRAALSSRLRTAGPGLGPDVDAVRIWLNAAAPEVRASVALGLTQASSGPAQGLLFWAYRKETHPQTRRAIVASIAKTPLAKRPDFRELLALDPDEKCREFLSEDPTLGGIGVHLGWATHRTTEVSDAEGRTLEVAPAPDGFVGIVRSSF